ncbi:MAG TPA: hypothetical protein VHJ20_21690 [Polyangia bacterium]|nr:hypothetical protein [Polyangia bacterium]
MTTKRPLTFAMSVTLSATLLSFASPASAQPVRRETPAERHEEHHEAVRQERHDERLPARTPPPAWRAHPPGAHPHGPVVRPHAVRVLRPRAYRWGEHPWHHWVHAEFARPVYYWDWNAIHGVTCTAEDSYGDQYPVSLSTFAGFGLENMTTVEDDALDRCYEESGGDPNCYLATCAHY